MLCKEELSMSLGFRCFVRDNKDIWVGLYDPEKMDFAHLLP